MGHESSRAVEKISKPVSPATPLHRETLVEKPRHSELSEKIAHARKEYARMFEEDPRTWEILNFGEIFKALKERLAKKGIVFTEAEEITLRTALTSSL